MSYLQDLRAHAKSIRKMHGSERSPMQRAVFVLDGEICRAEREIEEKDIQIDGLEVIRLAADYLYWQLHNIKTVTPRWANENVCEAMRNLGEALERVSTGLTQK